MVAGSVAGSVSRQCTCESDGIYGCISKETGPVAELAATLRHRRRTFVAWDELLASRQAKIALWTSCGEREKLTEVLGSVAERTLSWLALVVGSSVFRCVFSGIKVVGATSRRTVATPIFSSWERALTDFPL